MSAGTLIVRELSTLLAFRLTPQAVATLKRYKRLGKDAARALRGEVKPAADAAGNAGQRAGRKGAQGMGLWRRAAQALGRTLKTIVLGLLTAGAAIATLGLSAFVRNLIGVNEEFEKLKGQLRVVTGGTEQAAAAMKQLKKFAAETPFQLEEVVRAFTILKSLRLDTSESSLRAYGNIAAIWNRSIVDFANAVRAATTGEFEPLKAFNVVGRKVGKEVEFLFEGTKTRVKNDAASIAAYLKGIGETRFAGTLEEQAGRLPNLLSNVKDATSEFFRQIGSAGAIEGMERLLKVLLGNDKETAILADALGKGLKIGLDLLSDYFLLAKGFSKELRDEWLPTLRFVQQLLQGDESALEQLFGAEGMEKVSALVRDVKAEFAPFIAQLKKEVPPLWDEIVKEAEKFFDVVFEGGKKDGGVIGNVAEVLREMLPLLRILLRVTALLIRDSLRAARILIRIATIVVPTIQGTVLKAFNAMRGYVGGLVQVWLFFFDTIKNVASTVLGTIANQMQLIVDAAAELGFDTGNLGDIAGRLRNSSAELNPERRATLQVLSGAPSKTNTTKNTTVTQTINMGGLNLSGLTNLDPAKALAAGKNIGAGVQGELLGGLNNALGFAG